MLFDYIVYYLEYHRYHDSSLCLTITKQRDTINYIWLHVKIPKMDTSRFKTENKTHVHKKSMLSQYK